MPKLPQNDFSLHRCRCSSSQDRPCGCCCCCAQQQYLYLHSPVLSNQWAPRQFSGSTLVRLYVVCTSFRVVVGHVAETASLETFNHQGTLAENVLYCAVLACRWPSSRVSRWLCLDSRHCCLTCFVTFCQCHRQSWCAVGNWLRTWHGHPNRHNHSSVLHHPAGRSRSNTGLHACCHPCTHLPGVSLFVLDHY